MKLFGGVLNRLFTVVLALLAVALAGHCYAQDTKGGDYSTVTQVPREAIDTWLKQQVSASGGDWTNGRYHFYVGFSTGHYSSDPVSAIAMRRLAFGVMNNSLAVGDTLEAIAFEMTNAQFGLPVTLDHNPESRGQFVNAVPYAARAGSKGGHDIERALFETIQKIPAEEYHSSIVLLLNKDNASQAPEKEEASLFGADNRQLAAAIQKAGFRTPPERKVFQMQSGSNAVTVAITALFPAQLASIAGTFGPRYPTFPRETWQPTQDAPSQSEALPNPVVQPPPPSPPHTDGSSGVIVTDPEHHGISRWVWILLLLIVLAIVAFLIFGKKAGVQKPLAPVAAAALPKLETIPGALRLTIGPDEQTVTPLPRNGVWELGKTSDGKVTLAEVLPATPVAVPTPTPIQTAAETAPPVVTPATSTTPLARLKFNADRTLLVEAQSGAQFTESQGTAAVGSDSRTLKIEPGKRLLCRVLPPDASTKVRFEIVYEALAQGKK